MDKNEKCGAACGSRDACDRPRGASVLLALVVTILMLVSTRDARAQTDPCSPPVANPIACENSKTGNPSSEWDILGAGDPTIQGFATEISVNKGETVRFKVDTNATAYRLDIYRMGYYGGLGARKIATVLPSATLPQNQPPCLNESSTGLIDCGNWAQSASWVVPASATSGIYFAKLVRTNGGASHIVFVVRDDAGQSPVLFQTSDTTWQAYNDYGGNSLYTGSPAGRAFKVSYNRPFSTRAVDNGQDWVFNSEYPMVRWLEANGYNVSYFTGVDSDRRGAMILNHRVFLSVGHDEYWSGNQRANVEAARNAGVHLSFFSGNEVFWKTRWETSIDGTNTPYRTLVTYKETHANAKIDPDPAWTGTWRDPRFSPPADGGRPENALTGTIFTVNAGATTAIQVPEAEGKMRFWRNTSVATLAPGQTATLAGETLGYEWDEDLDNLFRPPGLVRLSSTIVDVPGLLLDFGSTYGPGTATHRLTLYRNASGALVFGAGTVQWAWGLDAEHDRGSNAPDPRMQQATVNLLADMGVQPATLQPGLIAAAASTDTLAPSSTITSPLPGSTVGASSQVAITGTAADAGGGVVGGVEVSVDGGATWHPANGRAVWTFAWTPNASGTVTIKSRAVDDSGNLEVPSAGVTLNVGPAGTCPCSIWSNAAIPAAVEADPTPVELGVKFRSDVSGFITGLRFYKGAGVTSPHVGSLWTSTGALLAQVTFTNETASGWQQANFPSPVAINADTTYVASYHTTGYAVDSGYFLSTGANSPPLHALASGVDGLNGVYQYGPGGFPDQSFNGSNYWVDVVFESTATAPPDSAPPTIQSASPANGATGVVIDSNVSATFSKLMDPATIGSGTFELRDPSNVLVLAAVTYDAVTRTATLDPVAPLALGTNYTATIRGGSAGVKDLSGNALAGDFAWSFKTQGCPCTIWSNATTPSLVEADPNPVELGVKFRSDVSGFITGLRFYKGAGVTGPHIGSLWTSTGILLAQVTFTNETASGWQQADFISPVAISANTTYVASYHTTGYAVDSGYFTSSGANNPPLRALASGLDGLNGVYQYGSGGFPSQSYNASNYWVDVLFNTVIPPDTTPPTASVSPTNGASGVASTANITAAFSEAVDPATIGSGTFELRDSSNVLVPAAVTYDVAIRKATLDPAAALALGTTYTATLKGGPTGVRDLAGNALAGDVVTTFTTLTCPCNIWSNAALPAAVEADPNPVELGVKFRSDLNGFITGLRFYKGVGVTGPHVGSLWTSTGTLLAQVTFTNETTSGWQQANFAAPVVINADTTYVASYHTTGYAVDPGYFASSGVDNSPLRALADGVDGSNGVFAYGSGGFPSSSYNSGNYWVDVVFDTTVPPDVTPPTVQSISPANGASGVGSGTNVTAVFSEPMHAATIGGGTFELRDSSNVLVPAAVTYDLATLTATLDPAAPLTLGTTYTATVKGGSSGVTDLAGNALTADVTTSFTVVAARVCPCTIWSDTAIPTVIAEVDTNSVELGVKFRSDSDGFITGLRFYKSSFNTGTHVGNLWTVTGTLLAQVTFAGETASGWQQANFSTPVAITANTTYVASYHTDVGRYSVDEGYFAGSGVDNAPLSALADGVTGSNGVFKTGASGFPVSTFNASNYWVDVVFNTTAVLPPDTTPPTVSSVSPPNGTIGVTTALKMTATLSEEMDPATVNGSTFELRDSSNTLVPAAVSYDQASRRATLIPANVLANSAAYTATIRGGATGMKDLAGNALAADISWSLSTAAPPPPPPDQGPGGPILVVASAANPFTRYYAEILRAEGLNAFAVADISTVSAATLAAYDVVILGEMPLTTAQVTLFGDWVAGGGNLITMRPDKKLAGLLGLTDAAATLSNAYLLVNTSAAPGTGIVGQTMQFHGTADRYTLNGATAVATLYASASAPTSAPAVTLNNVGGLGGQAAAFTYDLARSIVYTRQGNPAWVGQERDGIAPLRSDDMFFGNAIGDPQPDWVDLSKVAVPQADEQQRLLANLILQMNRDRKPLPRFWYLPRGNKAVVLMTGDDHANNGTSGRFASYIANSPVNCAVENWECIRGSSYVFDNTPLSDAEGVFYTERGFEVGLHVNTNCADWTPASLESFYATQLSTWATNYPSLPPPSTNRTHCIAWSDWTTQADVELAHGIRLDTTYYYYPGSWVADRPGMFTGSAMPMRFGRLDGSLIDVYQAATQMTDESGQTYPFTVDTLLDRALGPEGYYGVFTANMHTDVPAIPQDDAIIASALARNVPVVSGRQMLEWLDGRNGSSFASLNWNGSALSFTVAIGQGANGLQVMLPTSLAAGNLSGITLDGIPVVFTAQTIKGVQYATFPAALGTYQAIYAGP